MPNYCDYEMKIKGSKDAIKRVIKCLKAGYNYGEGKPNHKHFFRVFDVYDDLEMEDNGDGTFTQFIRGLCAWSIFCCMCSGKDTYYDSCKHSFPEIFMGTTLEEQSEDCEIEVFSEEEGMAFSEHYLYKNGECLIDDTVETKQAGYTKRGKITTHINWDTYDGDYVCLNPHKEAPYGSYLWEI